MQPSLPQLILAIKLEKTEERLMSLGGWWCWRRRCEH